MFTCYIGSWIRGGKDGWSSVAQRMIAYELNAHIAAYCRIYNDYGSIARDAKEGNLNSINFQNSGAALFPDGQRRKKMKRKKDQQGTTIEQTCKMQSNLCRSVVC